ncbi:MAG: NAD-dependent epimerase/dehydratase family protein [Planctomycetota bacterium]
MLPISPAFDRRSFLLVSAATSAVALLPAMLRAQEKAASPKKLRILILGGTGFLGPAIVRAAQARGHELTLFNRDKTNKDMFPDVARLKGNRDPKKDEGLKALEKGEWDVCFDDCGYVPRIVDASASLLKGRVGHYVFVSSISAFAGMEKEGLDENAPLGTMADPTVEDMGKDYANYGPLKALCEQAAEKVFPGRCTNIRPGYIVGPEDRSDRFTYWPVRAQRGGAMLAPGAPSDPVQVIDVRDLGEWMVRVAENKTYGVFNACGPAKKLSWGELLEACKAASANDTKLVWVDAAFLMKQEGLDLNIWSPYEGKSKGDHSVSNAAAVKAGLTFRPIAATAKDTLAWFNSLPAERRSRLRVGITAEEAAQLAKEKPVTPEEEAKRESQRSGMSLAQEAEVLAKFAAR